MSGLKYPVGNVAIRVFSTSVKYFSPFINIVFVLKPEVNKLYGCNDWLKHQ